MNLVFAILMSVFSASAQVDLSEGNYKCTIFPNGKAFDGLKLPFNFEVKNQDLVCKKLYDESDPELGCDVIFDMSAIDQLREEFDAAGKKFPLFFLNGLADGGYWMSEKGNFVVVSDSDGVEGGKMILYANSGFSKGTIEGYFSGGGEFDGDFYGEVFCQKD